MMYRRNMSEKAVASVRLDDLHMRIIDDLRRAEPDIPTRSEMIRRVIERAGSPRETKSTKQRRP